MINYSIIVPHYNIPHLLQRCLESIPEREDIEVIVNDDNSPYPNNLPYKNRKNVRYILNKSNEGAGVRRNEAIAYAKGKWMLCVDADDFLLPDSIEIMDKYINTNNDVIIFKAHSCMSDNLNIPDTLQRSAFLNGFIDEYLTGKNNDARHILFRNMAPWCKMIKLDFIRKNNIEFSTTRLGHEDNIFSIKIAVHAKSIAVCDNPIYCVTERDESLTTIKTDIARGYNRLYVLREINEYMHSHNYKGYVQSYKYYELKALASNIGKWDYIKFIYKAQKWNLFEPYNVYKIEKIFKMRYPYIYMLGFKISSPNYIPNFIKNIWRKIC